MVNNGQPANQDTFNNAFVSKTATSGNDVTGVVSMSNGSSGGSIANVQAEINAKLDASEKGAPNGVAELDGSGRVPASQLPSYVDDVLEYADLASFPNPGEIAKIYVALDTNKTYRWSGSVYIEISPSEVTSVFGRTGAVVATSGDYTTAQVTEDTNLYFTDTRARTAVVDDAIVDGVTNKAPSQNAVYDALALKQDSGSYITALTGEVTASGPGSAAATISSNVVSNSKLSQVSSQTIKGRTTAGTGNVEDLTATQATAILNSFTGDSGAGGVKGLVPAPSIGDGAKYLKGDGTWATVTAGQGSIQFKDEGTNLGTAGTVTSVNFTGTGVTASRVGNDVTVAVTGDQAALQFKDEGTNLGTAGTVASVNFTGSGVLATRSGNDVTVAVSGSGKNYFNYADFENNATTGWALGTTGTLTNAIPTGTPTFGSGASGNLSIASTASGPLRGSYSLSYASSAATTVGNMLHTDAIAIDTADQAKVLTFKFYYSPTVNPDNANWSGTSSNSFGVAVYDVTNNAWLGVAGGFSMTQRTGVGIASGTFQTNSNTASIRFCVYNANASSGAITLLFDDFYLGTQMGYNIQLRNPVGTIISTGSLTPPTGYLYCDGSEVSRTTYSDLFTAIGTTYGAGNGSTTFNIPNLKGAFARGAGTQTRYQFTVTAANATAGAVYSNNSQTFTVLNTIAGTTTLLTTGTGNPTASGTLTKVSGTGDASIAFSAFVSFSYSSTLGAYQNDQLQGHKHNSDNGGRYWVEGSGGSYAGGGNVIALLTNTGNPVSDGTNGTPRTGSETRPASASVAYHICYSIGNVVVSSDTDTRVVAAQFGASTANLTTTAATTINWPTLYYDTHGAYSAGTYTIPVSGYYKFTASEIGVNTNDYLFIYKNGSKDRLLVYLHTNYPVVSGSTEMSCSAGDLITIRTGSGGQINYSAGNYQAKISVERLSGPSVVAASETVAAKFSMTTNMTTNSTTPFNYDNKIYDTHSAVATGASWRFTCPVSGRYSVKIVVYSSAAPSVPSVTAIYKGGAALEMLHYNGTAYGYWGTTATTIYLNAGEYIDVRTTSNYPAQGGTYGAVSASYPCMIDIERVGN